MKHSTISPTVKTKYYCVISTIILLILATASLFVGKYPLSLELLLARDPLQLQVFFTLRLSRTIIGLIGGFSLGVAGFIYQTIFRNPLASPDIIGVSSGASAGAAAGILFLSSATGVTISAFAGSLIAMIFSLALSKLDRTGRNSTIVLAGISVHAFTQTILMFLKLSADPERELASIEYWLMGSLNSVNSHTFKGPLLLCIFSLVLLFLLHRQVLLLSAEEGEAKMLGVHVPQLRFVILFISTLIVASIISLTGLISFVGLLAPHVARLLSKNNRIGTMLLSGLTGGILLCCSDILARSITATELPISIFTSLLGAPFLVYLIVQERRAL